MVVSATDSDVGINAQITCFLNKESLNSLRTNEPFAINPQTGAITTIASLDRETVSAYLLTVTAKDGGNPYLQQFVGKNHTPAMNNEFRDALM